MFKKLKLIENQLKEIRIRIAKSANQIRQESPNLNTTVSMIQDVITSLNLVQEADKIRLTIIGIAVTIGMLMGMGLMFLIIR